MRSIIKKIAYLQGLCEGMNISQESKEGRIIVEILDVLDGLTDEILDMEFSDEDDDWDEEEEENVYSYAFICPSCGQELEVDEEIIENEEELTCPACGNIVPVIDEFNEFED